MLLSGSSHVRHIPNRYPELLLILQLASRFGFRSESNAFVRGWPCDCYALALFAPFFISRLTCGFALRVYVLLEMRRHVFIYHVFYSVSSRTLDVWRLARRGCRSYVRSWIGYIEKI